MLIHERREFFAHRLGLLFIITHHHFAERGSMDDDSGGVYRATWPALSSFQLHDDRHRGEVYPVSVCQFVHFQVTLVLIPSSFAFFKRE
jgi:hypothetical protein